MKLYLISSIEPEFKDGFSHQTRLQNFKVAQIIAIFSIVAGFVWRSLVVLFNYDSVFTHFDSYRTVNISFGIISFIYTITLILMRKRLSPQKLVRYHNIVWLFALIFILKNIWIAFIAQQNPSNTLAMLMIGFFIIAATMVFSIRETLLICVISFTIFAVGLGYYQLDPSLWITNFTVFCILLITFFIISRLLYTYHSNYYIKVKMIEAKNREIELANESKNEILRMVAHDLRSPIANIQSIVALLQMPIQEGDEDTLVYYHHIKECCMNAEGIIREIIIAAKDENYAVLNKEPEDLTVFLKEVHDYWKKVINGKLELFLVIPEIPIVITINKNKIKRVLDNLIGNAIKFTPETNGIITIELKNTDTQVQISVKDNGIGIPQEHLPELFKKYSQAGRVGLKNENPIGLGLHISKLLVEEHGGKIWVESTENQGATFYILLPQ